MLGIEKYNEYIQKIDAIRKEAGELLKEKEEKNQRKILFLTDEKSKIGKLKIFSVAILFLLSGGVYTLLKTYLELKYIALYFALIIIIYIGFTIYEYILNKQINELKDESNITKNKEVKEKLESEYNKIYNITLYIICINEYYYDLKDLNGNNLINKWDEIIKFKKEAINSSMNYVITVDKYKDYLDEWIKNNK